MHNTHCGYGHSHEQKHTEACGCGHSHEHKHTEACGCGHNHEHTHSEACDQNHEHIHGEGCGCEHATLTVFDGSLSQAQADVLLAIRQHGYLPVARFVMRSSRNDEAYAVALEPVYISNPQEEMTSIKETGVLFESLEEAGLISLDYDETLKGYPYAEYDASALYAYFVNTVKEAGENPEFLFDTPCLEKGSIALTEEGYRVLEELICQNG